MLPTWFVAWTAFSSPAPQAQLPVRVVLQGSRFTLASGPKRDQVPVQSASLEEPESKKWPEGRVMFRKDDAYVVWDSRGLTTRKGAWVHSSFLTEIPVSPKIFTRDEIVQTNLLVQGGERKRTVSNLLGAFRDGTKVYLLLQWLNADNQPWLEALSVVDLADERPKSRLIGRFAGITLPIPPGENRLFLRDGKVAVWMKTDDYWGIGLLDSETETFDSIRVGGQLEAVGTVNDSLGWFVEKTGHPSQVLGRFHRRLLHRRDLVETRGSVRLMDGREPWIAVVHDDPGIFLQNLETGARLKLPTDPGFRWTAFGVLVWSPRIKPSTAVLYEPGRWTRLGEWGLSPARPIR